MKKDKKINAKKILTKKEPEKKLLVPLKKKAGRNNTGRITAWQRGGGNKRMYRIIDFGQEKINIPATVEALEYDPNRTAFIALLNYEDGEKRYCLAAHGLKVGDKVICAEKAEYKIGNRMKIKNIPVGTMVYNVEIYPGKGGAVVRSAGTGARILAHEGKAVNLEMPSGEIRSFLGECFASIGTVSYPEWRYVEIGKAGKSRLRGWRPKVRGSAMNPVDHPHGGGEGRAPIGLKYPKTPWGKHALGVKTRKSNKKSDKYILQRRKKKKKK